MTQVLIKVVVVIVIEFVMVVNFARRILVAKSFMATEEEIKKRNLSIRTIERIRKHRKKFDFIIGGILCTIIVPIFIIVVVPFVLDIPNIITENYSEFQGTIISDINQGGRKELWDGEIMIKSQESDTVVKIALGNNEVGKGDVVKVRYLPHLKVGEVLSVIQ